MGQLTIRADEALIARIRSVSAASDRSMNEFVVAVLDAATNPDLADSEAERVRARLALAGLLVTGPRRRGERPDRAAVEAARRSAGRGTALADLVSDGR